MNSYGVAFSSLGTDCGNPKLVGLIVDDFDPLEGSVDFLSFCFSFNFSESVFVPCDFVSCGFFCSCLDEDPCLSGCFSTFVFTFVELLVSIFVELFVSTFVELLGDVDNLGWSFEPKRSEQYNFM